MLLANQQIRWDILVLSLIFTNISMKQCYESHLYCMRGKSTQLIFLLNSEFTVCIFFSHFLKIGSVVIHTSADEPVTAIPRLKIKHGGNPSVSVGHYRLSGDKVCFMTDCLTVQAGVKQ